jgi:hypothetical protein
MKCPRCKSLMVQEQFVDLYDNTGRIKFDGWRCPICGHIFDSIILINRNLQPQPSHFKNRKAVVGVN